MNTGLDLFNLDRLVEVSVGSVLILSAISFLAGMLLASFIWYLKSK